MGSETNLKLWFGTSVVVFKIKESNYLMIRLIHESMAPFLNFMFVIFKSLAGLFVIVPNS